MGWVAVVHRLSCSTACGDLPGPGIEPVSLALQGEFLTTGSPGKPQIKIFYWMQCSLAVVRISGFVFMFLKYRWSSLFMTPYLWIFYSLKRICTLSNAHGTSAVICVYVQRCKKCDWSNLVHSQLRSSKASLLCFQLSHCKQVSHTVSKFLWFCGFCWWFCCLNGSNVSLHEKGVMCLMEKIHALGKH